MFNYQRVTKKLSSDDIGNGKIVSIIDDMMNDKEFMEFLFKPKGITNLTEVVSNFYSAMTRHVVIKNLVKYIKREDYDAFDSSHATFFYSLSNMALETLNELADEWRNKRKSGDVSNKEYKAMMAKIEDGYEYAEELFRQVKKIVKKKAKNLAADSHLDAHLCRIACYTIPEEEYIDRYKIGKFLDNLLTEMYSTIDRENITDFEDINWKVFFKRLFGKDNLAEVATFLLLEGHNRRDLYSTKSNVIRCWDSLTEFALQQLNAAPESIRDQLLELYIKRITRMFSNGTYELRVNILDIINMSSKFPQLADSVKKYSSKLREAMKLPPID